MQEFLTVNFTFLDSSFNIQLDLLTVIILLSVLLAIIIGRFSILKYLRKSHRIDAINLGFNDNSVVIKPSAEDKTIAYKIWVEMSTRKIGLEIDLNNDVIFDVYKSWYEFFSITREHIKEIPYNKFKNKESQAIILLSIDILNKGLRPHLTKWQAKFNKWYVFQYDLSNKPVAKEVKTPQEIQQNYEDYQELSSELMEVNSNLREYRKLLEEIAFNEKIS